jgi:CheY-like chemotaxis protein
MATLLIDDDPFALKLLGTQLQLLGCVDVTPCENASDALALLESPFAKIDLVFCDLQMPDIDGVEFVRHLARIGYRGGLALVSGEEDGVLQSVHALALDNQIRVLASLPKPVSSAKLRQVLLDNARLNGAAEDTD